MTDLAAVAIASIGVFFVASGCLKLWRSASTSEALEALAIPAKLHGPVVHAISFSELVIGALLIVSGGHLLLAVAGLMIVAFTFVLLHLARRAPNAACGCLGELGSGDHRVGLARNTLLGGLVVLAAWGARDPRIVDVPSGVLVALLIVIVTEGVGLLHAMRLHFQATSR